MQQVWLLAARTAVASLAGIVCLAIFLAYLTPEENDWGSLTGLLKSAMLPVGRRNSFCVGPVLGQFTLNKNVNAKTCSKTGFQFFS